MKTELSQINSSIQIRAENHNCTQRKIINQAMDYASHRGLEIVDIKFYSQFPYNASITLAPNTKFSKYLKAPSTCPFCNSGNISGDSWEAQSGQAWQEVECRDCGKEWHDIYQLSHYEIRGED
jgi:hypothetical protein